MNTLTPLGKFLRKLRIDHAERLADISQKIEVSVAMLSAVELGKKAASSALLDRIASHYDLRGKSREELERLAEESAPQVKIGLEGAADPARELAVAFARRFHSLEASEVTDMLDMLRNKKHRLEEPPA